MRTKMERMQKLLDCGFEIDRIDSDDTLNIHLADERARITFRFDRDDVRALWPRLFGDANVRSRPALAVAGSAGHATAAPQPRPYGLDDVVGFLERDREARLGWL